MNRSDRAAWAAICGDFGRIRQAARDYGLESSWRSLVGGARTNLHDWRGLLAEIEDRAGDEDDFGGRDPFTPRREALGEQAGGHGDFVCPDGRCGRRAPYTSLLEPPRCELLDRDMTR